jgi:hypothetical protein
VTSETTKNLQNYPNVHLYFSLHISYTPFFCLVTVQIIFSYFVFKMFVCSLLLFTTLINSTVINHSYSYRKLINGTNIKLRRSIKYFSLYLTNINYIKILFKLKLQILMKSILCYTNQLFSTSYFLWIC